MERDLERLKADPADSDAAFNFSVTAHHLADWAGKRGSNRETGKARAEKRVGRRA
jgi:hypothetical protein